MSAPSVLPNRSFSSPLGQRSMGTSLRQNADAVVDEDSTVRRVASPHGGQANWKHVPAVLAPDLFSNHATPNSSRQRAQNMSNSLDGSHPRIKRTPNRSRKRAMKRPRIATETFKSPPPSSSSPPRSASAIPPLALLTPPLQDSRKWAKTGQAPDLPVASQAYHYIASQASSQYSDHSKECFFTPPSTQRETPNLYSPLRQPITASKVPMRNSPLRQDDCPLPKSRSNILHSDSSPPKRGTGIMASDVDHNAERSSTSFSPKGPRRHVTIQLPQASSSSGSQSSVYLIEVLMSATMTPWTENAESPPQSVQCSTIARP